MADRRCASAPPMRTARTTDARRCLATGSAGHDYALRSRAQLARARAGLHTLSSCQLPVELLQPGVAGVVDGGDWPVVLGGESSGVAPLLLCTARLGVPPPWPARAAALTAIPADSPRALDGGLWGGAGEDMRTGAGAMEYTAVHLGPVGECVRLDTPADARGLASAGGFGGEDLGSGEVPPGDGCAGASGGGQAPAPHDVAEVNDDEADVAALSAQLNEIMFSRLPAMVENRVL